MGRAVHLHDYLVTWNPGHQLPVVRLTFLGRCITHRAEGCLALFRERDQRFPSSYLRLRQATTCYTHHFPRSILTSTPSPTRNSNRASQRLRFAHRRPPPWPPQGSPTCRHGVPVRYLSFHGFQLAARLGWKDAPPLLLLFRPLFLVDVEENSFRDGGLSGEP